jgi:hypothetical protein
MVQGQPRQTVLETPSPRKTTAKWTRVMVQVLEHLFCECEALSLSPSPTKKIVIILYLIKCPNFSNCTMIMEVNVLVLRIYTLKYLEVKSMTYNLHSNSPGKK